MSWNKKFQQKMAKKQEEANQAVIQANANLLDAMNIQFNSERIARRLKKMQLENHLGPKLFGVEP